MSTVTTIRDRIKSLRRVRAGDLRPNPKNWRTHPESQRTALRGVLEEVGYVDALLVRPVNGHLEIIDGHLRADIDPEQKVPVLIVDLDDDEAAKVLATFDPLAAMAETNAEQLAALLEEIQLDEGPLLEMLEELAGTADALVEGECDPDEVPEVPAEPVSKVGDLWLLGEHRLLCGDSTKGEDVARVMGGERGVLANTDPPYGVDYSKLKDGIPVSGFTKHQEKWGDIENDELTNGAELQAFLESAIRAAVPHMTENPAFYLWHPMLTQGTFFAAAAAADILIHRQIIWVKPGFVLTRSGMYHWKHELAFYGWIRGRPCPWYGDKSQVSVWEIGRDTDHGKMHPTQKPVELFTRPMLNHTRKGEVVYEPFAGSGSQIIAAEQLSRRCYAIEIEQRYVDVCVARWEKFTGKKAKLEKRRGRK